MKLERKEGSCPAGRGESWPQAEGGPESAAWLSSFVHLVGDSIMTAPKIDGNLDDAISECSFHFALLWPMCIGFSPLNASGRLPELPSTASNASSTTGSRLKGNIVFS